MTVVLCCFSSQVFFFQAEDGIRDLVRSRGLGDVYKRQRCGRAVAFGQGNVGNADGRRAAAGALRDCSGGIAVSYTHLTLPTSDLV